MDSGSERYAASDFVLIKNCLQDLELPVLAVTRVCPNLLYEMGHHPVCCEHSMSRGTKPQMCSIEWNRSLLGLSRCPTSISMHVCVVIWSQCPSPRGIAPKCLLLECHLFGHLARVVSDPALEAGYAGMVETKTAVTI